MAYNTNVGRTGTTGVYGTGGAVGTTPDVAGTAPVETNTTAQPTQQSGALAAVQALWDAGNKNRVWDLLTSGKDKPVGTAERNLADAAATVANAGVSGEINKTGQAIYGDKWTPQLYQEAVNNYQNSGNYNWRDLDTFLFNMNADPAGIGRTSSETYAKLQTDKTTQQYSDLLKPESDLYKQYFGEGGIIPSQFKAFQTSLAPAQEQSYQKLSDTLSARGLGSSGALQAGQQQIGKDYAQVLKEALEGMQSTGLQNLSNQAQSTVGYTQGQQNAGLQSVANSILQQQQAKEAAKYQEAINKASGWSWLTPALGLAGTLAGQPWLGALLSGASATADAAGLYGNNKPEYTLLDESPTKALGGMKRY